MVEVPFVVIFLLIFNFWSGTVCIDINGANNVIFIVRCSRELQDFLPGITTTTTCPGQTPPGSCQF